MEYSINNPTQLIITIDNTHIEQLQQFSYLGSKITERMAVAKLTLCAE